MADFTNKEIAKMLEELADLMEINGENKYKIRAYSNAGRKIMSISEDIDILVKENRLKDLKGIGEGIATTIKEICGLGYSTRLEELKTELPAGVLELVQIPGLGPKRAHKLFYELGINDIDDLKEALHKNKVRELDGFGPKIEEKLLNSLKNYEQYRELIFIDEAKKYAEKIITYIKNQTDVIDKIEVTGSTRRMKESIGDIDILIASDNPEKVNEVINNLNEIQEIIAQGKTKTSIRTDEGLQVDFRIVKSINFYAALQYFTGSREHNVVLRQKAKKNGYKLSEYGLLNIAEDKGQGDREEKIEVNSEKDIYKILGMQYIVPELRENRGEIEAAINDNLPHSIKLSDINGDLHMHSRFSDGAYTIEEMLKAACRRDYSYIAITDHSQSLRVAHGMSVSELEKQLSEIDDLQSKYSDIKIISGIEVDILTDGSLDYDDQVLSSLDLVIASIHTGFNQSEEQITDRIMQAMKNPYVNIIAHPQGRILGRRRAYKVNMNKVINIAAETDTCLEINSSPYRLDLDDMMAKKARENNVKFAINTDAHHINELDDIILGVGVARRGWLEKKDVINTMNYDNLMDFLK